ncbi:MAG: RagB/SusD family nutrient uptake outer membrane protein [Rikenellaceae bacterium]
MKIQKYIFLAAIGLCGVSCEDYLDVNPEMGVSAEDVYSNYTNLRSAIDRATCLVQNQFKTLHHGDICEVGALSDETQSLALGYSNLTTMVNQGLWQDYDGHDFGFRFLENASDVEGDTADPQWSLNTKNEPAGQAFAAIRAVNLALEGYETYKDVLSFPEENPFYSEEDLRNQILGECYFLRGFHYFQVLRRYGAMPNMQHSFASDYDFNVSRPTYHQSTDWCVEDLDNAITYLPEEWASPSDLGRPTKVSAKALKAMVLLYAASPLMNDTYPYTAEPTYNEEYLKRSVEASIAAIEAVELHDTRYIWHPWKDYKDNSTPQGTELNNEAIYQAAFEFSYGGSYWMNRGTGWYNFLGTHRGAMAQCQQPTHNAVKWFETIDGYAIEDAPESSYNPNNPYENRDPRLKFNIFCQGDDIYTSEQVMLMTAERGGVVAQMYEDAGNVFTGYENAKYLWPGQHAGTGGTGEGAYARVLAYIRMPQLYLDFAEAANELYGPKVAVPGTESLSVHTAVDAINKVRERVGGASVDMYGNGEIDIPLMSPVRDMYTTDSKTFRKRIYNERAVELFQEFHRWFDIRRWKLAVDLFKESTTCIKKIDIRVEGGETIYEEAPLEGAVRVFEPKHYWYPFPTSEMDKLGVFEQNPGW